MKLSGIKSVFSKYAKKTLSQISDVLDVVPILESKGL